MPQRFRYNARTGELSGITSLKVGDPQLTIEQYVTDYIKNNARDEVYDSDLVISTILKGRGSATFDSDQIVAIINENTGVGLSGFDSDQVNEIIREYLEDTVDDTGFDSDQVVAIINENAATSFDSDQIVAIIDENAPVAGFDSDQINTIISEYSGAIEGLALNLDNDSDIIAATINIVNEQIYTDSDRDLVSNLRRDLDSESVEIRALRADFDSDSAILKTLNSQESVSNLRSDLDSETARIQLLLSNADSDQINIAILRRDADSDSLAIQDAKTRAKNDAALIALLRNELDSETSRIEELEDNLDSESAVISSIRADLDSESSEIRAIRSDLDSDSIKIQQNDSDIRNLYTRIETVEADATFSGLTARLDSDENQLQFLSTRIDTQTQINNVQNANIQRLIDDVDSETSRIQIIQLRLDSDEQQLQTINEELNDRIDSVITSLDSESAEIRALRADIDSESSIISQIRVDIDSDSAKLQDLQTQIDSEIVERKQLRTNVDNLEGSFVLLRQDVDSDLAAFEIQANASFDSDQVVSIINENSQGLTDSDLKSIGDLRNDVDSDSAKIQSLTIRVEDLETGADSDRAAIAQLRRDADSDTIEIQSIRSAVDSDYALFNNKISLFNGLTDSDLTTVSNLRNDLDSESVVISKLRADLDSDSAVIQQNSTDLTSDISTINSRLDSDETQLQTINTAVGILQVRADSDETAIQTIRTDLDTLDTNLTARLDSDETAIQTIRTDLDALNTNLTARLDSDSTIIQGLRTDLDTLDTNLTARLDSDSTIIQGLRTELDTAVARLDSDEIALQTLDTTLNTLSTKVDSIEAGLDSETDRIQLLLLSTDSDALSIAGLVREADSDAAAIAELLRQADSDASAIQALNTTLTADISALTARADSDETAIQTLRTDLDTLDTNLTARLDSDSIIVQSLQGQIDTINTTVSGHTTDISTINGNLDSDEARLESIDARVDILENRADSDDTKLQDAITRIETLEASPALADSDYSNVAKIRNDLDSDSLAIQALGTSINTINSRLDSDETQLQTINTRIDNLGGSQSISVTAYTFTSPANDSDFSGADDNGRTLGYVIGKIHVYLNGILLTNSTDYSATDGSTVTLVNAPDSDDVLTIVKYLGTVQAGFDSDQIVTIITENTNPDTVARLDSDETKLQNHSIRLETLEARADSDETQLQVLNTSINGFTARLDSDSTAIQDNNTRIVTLEARADSDELQLQAINTSLSSRITDLETGADSDRAAIAQLRRDADSDSLTIQSIRGAVDSDYALFNNKIELFNGLTDSDLTTVSNLRNDVDSDSTKLQALETTVAGLSSTALADSDITVITGAKSLTTNEIIGGSVTDVDTFSTSLFRSVKYLVVASSDSDATYQADEILVVHDGTYAYLTQYAQVSTSDSELVTYDVTISSNNVLLQATPTKNNVRFDAQRLHVSVANNSILDLTIVPNWSSPVETTFRDSDAGAAAFYGRGVAISNDGNYAAFGADTRDDSDGSGGTVSNVGGVYIYKRSGSTWTREALLKADSENTNDYIGYDVSLNEDGTYCVAGCQTSGQPNKVRVFTRSGSTWSQQAELTASNAETYDYFGEKAKISADGNYIVVGAKQEDDSDGSTANCGALYIFKRDGVTWSEEAILRADDRTSNLYLGSGDIDITSDGSSVVAGATGGEAAYVFTRTGSTWTQQAKLTASNSESGDNFGYGSSISKDGNYIIVGAIFEDDSDNSVSSRGAAYIFKKDGSSWSEEAILYSSDGAANDRFGNAATINSNGKYVAVGANLHDVTGTNNEGAVYIFQRDGTTWTQIKKLVASDGQTADFFGADVDFTDNAVYCVVGATHEDGGDGNPFNNMGQGYIFDATP